MGKPRIENLPIMLFLLSFVLITLALATANNVSSNPCDNKVSSFLFGVKKKNVKYQKYLHCC